MSGIGEKSQKKGREGGERGTRRLEKKASKRGHEGEPAPREVLANCRTPDKEGSGGVTEGEMGGSLCDFGR